MGVRDDGKPDRRHVERKTKADVVQPVGEPLLDGPRPADLAYLVAVALLLQLANCVGDFDVMRHLVSGIGAHRIDKLEAEHPDRPSTVAILPERADGLGLQVGLADDTLPSDAGGLDACARPTCQGSGSVISRAGTPVSSVRRWMRRIAWDAVTQRRRATNSVASSDRFAICRFHALSRGDAVAVPDGTEAAAVVRENIRFPWY